MTEDMSIFSLLHLIVLLQVIVGLLCEAVTIILADEVEIYFRFYNFMNREFYG